MITLSQYNGKQVGVFGMGKAGEAAVSALYEGGATVFAWDDRFASDAPATSADERLYYADPVQWPWQGLAALVLSPGIPLTHPKPHAVVELAKQHGCPIVGDIELLYQACPDATYVGITGTNGKSTTTTLIGHILHSAGVRCEVGGNLGTAALSLEPLGKNGVYVLELSSYQLDLIHTPRFNVALLLNVTPDHLDRHGSMEGYIAAKLHIFDRQQTGDTAVIAVDDVHTQSIVANHLRVPQVVQVSAQRLLPEGIYVEHGVLHDGALRFDISNVVTLTGKHNWQNAAAAYAVTKAVGVKPETIYKAMQSFSGLRHRLQQVAVVEDVRFVNDSKATNADATSHALAAYENIYWIAGGKAKSGGIESLDAYFPRIAHAFLIGEAENMFAGTLDGKIAYTRSETLDQAVHQAFAMARKEKKQGAVVLLSPACASFDQFTSFEHRGDVFCELVNALQSSDVGKKHAL